LEHLLMLAGKSSEGLMNHGSQVKAMALGRHENFETIIELPSGNCIRAP